MARGSDYVPGFVNSFWGKVGELSEKAVVGAFDSAKAAFADESDDPNNDFKVIGDWVNSHVFQSSPVQKYVVHPIIWTGHQASHVIAAGWTAGDVAEANGGSQWTPFYSPGAWKDAWNATEHISGGEAIAQSFLADADAMRMGKSFNLWDAAPKPKGGMFGNTPESQAERKRFEEWRRTPAGQVTAGALDILTTWYADPTIVAGKAAKAARVANRVVDAAQAEKVSEAFTAGDLATQPARRTAAGVFSGSADETASRLSRGVARTDNMDTAQVAAHLAPLVRRTAAPQSIIDLFGQAGRITDLTLQRQVKADILLSAAGSKASQARLVESAPAIARAMQRESAALPEFAVLDRLAGETDGATGVLYRRGDALTDAARALGNDTANAAEIEAYGRKLDRIHRHMRDVFAESDEFGGLERVGSTALDRAKAAVRTRTAQQFYFQDGTAGRTVRVLHWAANQRSRGVVATNDALRGHDELMDHLTRSKLFDAAERRHISQTWWAANGQNLRNKVVDDLWGKMVARAAEKHGMTEAEARALMADITEARAKGRAYTAAQMEKARVDGLSRVTLNDPVTGTATSIDRALFETHLRNNVALPDTHLIERTIRDFQNKKGLPDRLSDARDDLLASTDALNDWWRLAVLARPGLFVRTQLDSQARSVAMLGATTVVRQAMTGLGHKVGARLNRDQLVLVAATAEDLLRQQDTLERAAELRRQAELLTGADGQRLLDRAAELEKAANRPIKHITDKRFLGATDKTVKIKGQNVTTRAYVSDEDRIATWQALLPGDATLSDAILALSNKSRGRFSEKAGDWLSYDVADPKWAAAYVRHIDAMRRSHTGARILAEADHPTADLVASLRADDLARKEWLDVRFDNPDFDDWIDRAISEVAYMAPTGAIRKAITAGKRLEEGDVERLFAKVDDDASLLPQRMSITGPSLSAFSKDSDVVLKRALKRVVQMMSDAPDTVLARHPLYVARYFTHFKELAGREIDRAGELGPAAQAKIEKAARHRAIQDVRETMYDTARHTGAHSGLMRIASPFLGAWEDAIISWGRLMYDDPGRLGALVKTWTAPERLGLVVDKEGRPVKPGQTGVRQAFVTIPLPGFAKDWTGVEDFKIRKDSFNSIFQGDVPWLPGSGPMVQIPASQIVARSFPELGDPDGPVPKPLQPFMRALLNGDSPKYRPGIVGFGQDAVGGFTPGWARKLVDAFNPSSPSFTNVFADSVNSQIIAARQAGRPIPSQETLKRNALKAARNTTIVKSLALGILGLSGEGAGIAEFYSNQYNLLQQQSAALHAQGTTPEQRFNKLFPEAAGLNWSVSKNETGINATVKVENRTRKFKKDIEANPEYGWFYVGSDNVGGRFSASVYNAQSGRRVSPGSDTTQRHRVSPDEMLDRTLVQSGWDQYNQVMTKVNLALEARGLHSTRQKGAEQIAQIKAAFIAEMKAANRAWAKDYDTFDSGKLDRFITQVAKPALKDARLKNRTDIVLLGQYLALRDKAIAIAKSNGYTLASQKAANLVAVLNQAGQEMAAANIGFEQIWNRTLSREVEVDGG